MKDSDILDMFGKLLIQEAYDNHIAFAQNDLIDLKQTERFKNLFGSMDIKGKKELELQNFEILSGLLFDFLKIFVENDDFKIIYESHGTQLDLVALSESLMADPIIKNGWIDRFSQYENKF